MSLIRKLYKLEGTIAPAEYFVVGVLAFGIKYAIDWSIASFVFGRAWSPLSYWHLVRLGDHSTLSPLMLFVLLVISLPFLWLGMAMTLLRLRDVSWSAGWASLFFVPVVNVILFAVLCVAPSRPNVVRRDLSGLLESALFAVVACAALGIAGFGLATHVLVTYGLGLFIGVPFTVGYLSAYIHRRRYPTAGVQIYLVALFSTGLLGGLLLAFASEGLLCLLMSLPLALVVAMLGAYLGSRSAGRPERRTDAPGYAMVALLPLLLVSEAASRREAPIYRVDTSIIVNAPAERVWANVVSFSEIKGEPEWYFRAGIAYPLRARISGHGRGAVRYCEFTTGAFVEPIEIWEEPHLLRFTVTSIPAPMHELSPYEFDAPHLHGFLVSERGQFLLRRLPGDKTLVTGTTWYRHHLWPAAYWRFWSDAIIHRIHLRVLRHVKELSDIPATG
jgi:uncharacterized membrane protein YhaH (DUF805 family)